MRPRVWQKLVHLHGAGLVLLVQLMFGRSASAEPQRGTETIILLQPTSASLELRRSLARIRDELSADRYRVISADSGTTDEPGAIIESTGSSAEPSTVLAVFGDPATGQGELCVIQRSSGRTAVRRATVVVDAPERMPEALASKALELLRATALELSLTLDRTAQAQPPPEPRSIAPGAPSPTQVTPDESIVSVDMGLGIWKSVEGPPPALTPVGRLGFRLTEWSLMRLSLAGLGSRPVVHSEYGTATISQSMALVEFAVVPQLDHRIVPLLSIGAGVLNVAVTGSGVAPWEGVASRQWSTTFDGGAGIAVAIGSHTSLATELHALLASPHPVVRFADTRAATIGEPSLMFSITLRVVP